MLSFTGTVVAKGKPDRWGEATARVRVTGVTKGVVPKEIVLRGWLEFPSNPRGCPPKGVEFIGNLKIGSQYKFYGRGSINELDLRINLSAYE